MRRQILLLSLILSIISFSSLSQNLKTKTIIIKNYTKVKFNPFDTNGHHYVIRNKGILNISGPHQTSSFSIEPGGKMIATGPVDNVTVNGGELVSTSPIGKLIIKSGKATIKSGSITTLTLLSGSLTLNNGHIATLNITQGIATLLGGYVTTLNNQKGIVKAQGKRVGEYLSQNAANKIQVIAESKRSTLALNQANSNSNSNNQASNIVQANIAKQQQRLTAQFKKMNAQSNKENASKKYKTIHIKKNTTIKFLEVFPKYPKLHKDYVHFIVKPGVTLNYQKPHQHIKITVGKSAKLLLSGGLSQLVINGGNVVISGNVFVREFILIHSGSLSLSGTFVTKLISKGGNTQILDAAIAHLVADGGTIVRTRFAFISKTSGAINPTTNNKLLIHGVPKSVLQRFRGRNFNKTPICSIILNLWGRKLVNVNGNINVANMTLKQQVRQCPKNSLCYIHHRVILTGNVSNTVGNTNFANLNLKSFKNNCTVGGSQYYVGEKIFTSGGSINIGNIN